MTDELGDRMKGYENISRQHLIKRMPVVIRLDGKAFHTYTKGCDKPFDKNLHWLRERVLDRLCNEIQGCVFGYSQSDEISLVLKDWDTLKTSSWFDNNLQKLVSVSASMCTAKWNYFVDVAIEAQLDFDNSFYSQEPSLYDKIGETPPAQFDSRAWNLPREEVVNYLLWRQKDWERNSVQMLGRAYYSHKELNGVSCKEIITKVEEEQGVVWGELPIWQKRGEFWLKGEGLIKCPRFNEARDMLEGILNEQES